MSNLNNLDAVVVTAKFELTINIDAEGVNFSSRTIETEIVEGWSPDGKITQLDILTGNSASKQRISLEIPQEAAPKVTALAQSTMGKNGTSEVSYNNIQQNLKSATTQLSDNVFEYDLTEINVDASSGLLNQTCKISGSGKVRIHHI